MEIDILKSVIHVLNRDSEESLLNEYELEINEDLYQFLEKHIVKSIIDEDSRKAKFGVGLNVVREVSSRIGQDDSYFLEGSKEIARQLFKAMKTNTSISSTDLIVCLYIYNGCKEIAILKMDYSTSYIHDIQVLGDKFKISIKKQEISLPNISQKIQKCAFIKTSYGSEDYDLLILDNQTNSKSSEDPIALFFINTFLGAELVSDNKIYTKIFKKETENWIKEKIKEGESAVEDIRDHVITALHENQEVHLEDFSYKAFGNKLDLRDDYVNTLKDKGLVDEKFSVDKELVERKYSKIRLKTDSNIEIVLDYSDYTNKDKIEIVLKNDGTKDIVIKNVINLFEK